MEIVLSKPQAKFALSSAKSIAAVAGFGSGKTEIALFTLFNTMFKFPGANMLYLAPTFPLIRDIWYPKVEAYLDRLKVKYHINRGEHTINIFGMGKIFCRTMEHPHRIVGFEVLDAFLDELDVLPTLKALEVWRKAKARCRQKILGKINQMFVTTTPEGFKATHQLFKQTPLAGSELIQMSTYSNQHNLPSDYIDELKLNYPDQLIEAYINGKFVNLLAMPVWGGYDPILNNSTVTVDKRDTLLVGMDFNVGRGCAVIHVQRERSIHAVDEVVDSYDTPDTIRVLEERYPKHRIIVFPDASGKSRKSTNATTSDIQLLKQAGFEVKAKSKNPPIKNRVMAANRLFCNGFKKRHYFVNKEAAPRYAQALEQQAYDKNGLPEKGAGKYDDLTDAGTYPIEFLFPVVHNVSRELVIEGN